MEVDTIRERDEPDKSRFHTLTDSCGELLNGPHRTVALS